MPRSPGAWLRLLAAFLVAMVVIGLLVSRTAGASGHDALYDQLRKKQSELEQIQKRLQDTERRLQQTQKRQQTVTGELRKIEGRLAQAERDLDYLENQILVARAEIQRVSAELAQAEAELARRTRLLGARVRAAYELGTVSYLEVLFSATSFSDFITRFASLQAILRTDVDLLDTVQAQRDAIAQKKADLEARRAELERLEAQVTYRKASYEAAQRDRQQALARLESEEEAYRKALDEWEALQESISKDIAALQREIARLGGLPTDRSQIKMIWPTRSTRITSGFGWRYHPIIRQNRFHQGIDIGAPTGDPIYAAAMGRVIFAGWLGGYGYAVIMDHGAGVATLYGHASKLLVTADASKIIPQGAVIALIGSTGMSTGPHLHFEVRIEGKQVQPLDWVRR